MKYVSIDIETTGLNPETDQILEFGAVIEDTHRQDIPVDELPTFRRVILHDRLEGSPGALVMNADLIKEISNALSSRDREYWFCRITTLSNAFAHFLANNNFEKTKYSKYEFVVAGKNFGVFDRAFLDKVPHWNNTHQPLRRTLDPAILYFNPLTDEAPPSLSECLKRAGLPAEVRHTAVEDARDVIRVLRTKFLEQGRGS